MSAVPKRSARSSGDDFTGKFARQTSEPRTLGEARRRIAELERQLTAAAGAREGLGAASRALEAAQAADAARAQAAEVRAEAAEEQLRELRAERASRGRALDQAEHRALAAEQDREGIGREVLQICRSVRAMPFPPGSSTHDRLALADRLRKVAGRLGVVGNKDDEPVAAARRSS